MGVVAKICGLSEPAHVAAAAAGGAGFIGLVFYPPSPRSITPARAGALLRARPEGLAAVGLLVDPEDALIESILAEAPLDLLQLHGEESPERVAEIRQRFGLPVMKTIKVRGAHDLEEAKRYLEVADRLLFDAKCPPDLPGALPGGNALAFDWDLLSGRSWPLPWMLAGGLTAANVAEAVTRSGATAVDVSSGVEKAPGRKDAVKIAAFLDAVAAL